VNGVLKNSKWAFHNKSPLVQAHIFPFFFLPDVAVPGLVNGASRSHRQKPKGQRAERDTLLRAGTVGAAASTRLCDSFHQSQRQCSLM
jgi:hypothetical protein